MLLALLLTTTSAFAHQTKCDDLLTNAVARAYQARAHRIVSIDVDPERHLAYVGISRTQLLELLNEGEIHARRWGHVPSSFYPIADREALRQFRAQNEGVVIVPGEARQQYNHAWDEAWSRAVIETMEKRFSNLRDPNFYNFLGYLRQTQDRKNGAAPTLRQIMEATAHSTLPKAGVTKDPQFRTLVQLLNLPWNVRGGIKAGDRHALVVEAFRTLPAEAGVVLVFGESVLNKVIWQESGRAEMVRIDLDDVLAIEASTDEDFELLERLTP